jgi:hypothetical protein
LDPKRVSTNSLGSTGLGSIPPVTGGVVKPAAPIATAAGPVGPSPFVSEVSGEPPAQRAYGSGEPTAPEPVVTDPMITVAPDLTVDPDPMTTGVASASTLGVDDTPPTAVAEEPAEESVEEPVVSKPVNPMGVTEEPVTEEPTVVSPLGGVTRGPKL